MTGSGTGSTLDIEPGDTLETAMLSPCVGGLVRTWTDQGSRLWGVADPSSLASQMGRGIIARTLREERRFREVALLHEPSGTLLLQPRRPTANADGTLESAAPSVQLTDPGPPTSGWQQEFKELLGQAVRYTVEADGLLVVELGGWDAPLEPYCLFIVTHEEGEVIVLETAPPKNGSTLWQPHIHPGRAGTTVTAPATDATLSVAPLFMFDALATWGVDPWDIAITYGNRS